MNPATPVLVLLGAYCLWLAYHLKRTDRALTALRRNCFVTNERGHRVRYASASDECRARAES